MIRLRSNDKAAQHLPLVYIKILSNGLHDRDYSQLSFESMFGPTRISLSLSRIAPRTRSTSLQLRPLQLRPSPRNSRRPSNTAHCPNRLLHFLCGVFLTVSVQYSVPSPKVGEVAQCHNQETAEKGWSSVTTQSLPQHSPDKIERFYPPLNSTGDSIRLTTVSSGNWEDPIEGTVEMWPTEKNQKYKALSYHWDAKPGFRWIRLNGADFNVTANLYDALQHFRNPYSSLVIWADAINLNQRDDEEMSRQVKLMTSIYQRAVEVLVWLGTCHEVHQGS